MALLERLFDLGVSAALICVDQHVFNPLPFPDSARFRTQLYLPHPLGADLKAMRAAPHAFVLRDVRFEWAKRARSRPGGRGHPQRVAPAFLLAAYERTQVGKAKPGKKPSKRRSQVEPCGTADVSFERKTWVRGLR